MWILEPNLDIYPSFSSFKLYDLRQAVYRAMKESESHSVMSGSLQPPWTIQFMKFSRPEYWSGWPFPSPGDLPNPGIKPGSAALQVDSLPAEPQGKPKNTGVGSLSLLQQIFPTQESNQGFLHCRRILYQLSYQGRSTQKHFMLVVIVL